MAAHPARDGTDLARRLVRGGVRLLTEPVGLPEDEAPHRAGVSSFGISGTNAHVILEQAPAPEPARQVTPETELPALPLLLSAHTAGGLREQARRLATLLTGAQRPRPVDLAWSLLGTRARLGRRAAVLGGPEQLVAGLTALAEGRQAEGVRLGTEVTGRTAFVFPGQGAQRAGMGRALYDTFPEFAAAFDTLCAHLDPLLERPLREVAFAAAGTPEAELLDRTDFTQPALFAFEVALFRLLESWGLTPEHLLGHSIGELAAAQVAGMWSVPDACLLVAARGRLMRELGGSGAMLAVRAGEDELPELLAGREDRLCLAAVNGPSTLVLSGSAAAVAELAADCAAKGRRTRKLPVAQAYHSSRMEPMLAEFRAVTQRVTFHQPRLGLVSAVTGEAGTGEMGEPEYWVRQVRETVRFAAGVRALAASGVTRFAELGPDSSAAAMVADCLAEQPEPGAVVAARPGDRPEVESVLGIAAQLHLHGAGVDWDRVFAGTGAGVIDLPTYPFQRERYWPQPPAHTGGTAGLELEPVEHPWLTVRPELAEGAGQVLAGRLSPAEHPWLADHVLHGTTVLPGTGLIELAAAAARACGASRVDNLAMVAPLVLPEDGAVRVQVAIGAETGGPRSVAVYGRAEDGGSWTLHATGAVATGTGAPPGPGFAALRDWPVPGAEDVPMTGFYQRFADQGVDYGPALRTTVRLWRRGDRGYGLVRLPDGMPGDGFGLHPALLDGALNVMRACQDGGQDAPLAQVPVECTGMELYATGGTELRVLVEARPHPDGRTLAVWLADAVGEPVGRISALELRSASAAQLSAAAGTGRGELYQVLPRPVRPATGPVRRPGTVVLGGAGRVAEALGCPAAATVAELAAEGAAPGRIVVDATEPAAEPESVAVETLSTLQLLLRRPEPAELVWVTAAGTGPELSGAPVRGLLRAARAEHPEQVLRLVEWDGGAEHLAAALELAGEPDLLVHGPELQAPRLARAERSAADGPPSLDPEGTALITGGTGELGRVVAHHLLATHGIRRLLLTSRRGEDAPGARELAAELTAAGATSVRVLACDVANRDQVATVLSEVDDKYPLTAVLHLAGVLDDGLLLDHDPDRLRRVFAPKVAGARHLDELTRDRPPAAFVLFSSAAGTIGTAGQGGYAAANAVLDAIATSRRAAGLPATSLAWGLWQQSGEGMTAGLGQAGIARLRRRGISPLPVRDGLRLLDRALRNPAPHLVPIAIDLRAVRREAGQGAAVPAVLYDLLGGPPPTGTAGGTRPVPLRERLLGLPRRQRLGELTTMVLRESALVLGLADPADLDPRQPLAERGLDSLMAVELRRRLAEAAGVPLPATLIFDHPAPRGIAGLLLSTMDPGMDPGEAGTAPARTGSAAPPAAEPVAIVGMGCRYPGGIGSPDDLWDLVAGAVDTAGEFPGDRGWDLAALFHPDPDRAGTSHTRFGGFLADAAGFDAGFFGMSPREAVATDAQQRLLLEVSWEALERAGIDPHVLRGSPTGVFAGVMYSDYATLLGAEFEGYQSTGSAPSVASGRVAYALGLEGPAVTVDTACSSSLVALHWAAQALRSGECSLALAGGVTVMATPSTFVDFSRQGGLAPDGRCKAYSDAADGTGWSEGVGMLVLERLSDAERNGHRILAVVRGSAVNSDGASNGLTAPNGPSQQRVIRQALGSAGLSTSEVDVVEGHGTGTPLGDPIEVQAVLATYGQDRETPLLLGSVKSNLGHTQAAAGVAGVIKMVQAMRHGQLPRTLHADAPSSQVDWTAGKVELLAQPAGWPETDHPRRAGVSSFGVSGTNAHVILEQPPATEPAPVEPDVPAVVPWVLSARTEPALRDLAGRLAGFLDTHPAREADVGFALATSRAGLPCRAVLLGADQAELRAGLHALAEDAPSPALVRATAARTGGLVFVFPGQGAQWTGMARDLLATSPVFAEAMAGCARALAPHLDLSPIDALADAEALARVEVVQPTLWAVLVSLAAVWRELGIRPDAVVGHSQGEVAAAVVAGGLSIEDGALVVARRSRAIAHALAGSGGMASVALPVEEVEDLLRRFGGRLSVAAVNGPAAVVVSGAVDALRELAGRCAADGVRARILKVDYASHSAQVEVLEEVLAETLAPIRPRTGEVPFYSTVTGAELDTATLDARYWYRNLRQQVRFQEATMALAEAGHGTFVEVSPHPVLAAELEDTLDGAVEHPVVTGTLRREDGGIRRLLASLGHLWGHGVEVDWTRLLPGADLVELPTYPFQHERYWPRARAGTGDAAGLGLAAAGHPVLGGAVELAGQEGLLLTGRLSLETHPWLADHRVRDQVLFPGAGLVELAVRAGDETGCGSLADLTLTAPLALPERGGVRIQVQVEEPAEDGNRAVTIHSRPDEPAEAGWTRHASGTLAPGVPEVDTTFAESWPPRGATEIDLTGCYQRAAERGYGYGPAFRGLTRAWSRDGEVLAEVVLPDEVPGAEGFGLHPALLDAALHPVLVAGFDLPPGALPFSWHEVCLHAVDAGLLRVRLTAGADGTIAMVAADTGGGPVVSVGTLVLRAGAAERATGPGPAADSLYTVDWNPVPLPRNVPEGPVGVLGTGLGVPGEVRFAGIGELAGGDEIPELVLLPVSGTGADPVTAAHETAEQVLGTLRGWLGQDRCTGSRLVLLTRGARAGADLAAATTWGLLRTAISEHPGRFGLLDLETEQDLPAALPHLLAGEEPQLAVREGVVCAPRLAADRTELAAPPGAADWRLDVHTPGSVDGLGLVPCPAADQELSGRQVRMAVSAAGLNFRDLLSTLGFQEVLAALARYESGAGLMGVEAAGVVVETGPEVTGLRTGDRVMGVVAGGFGPMAVVDERRLIAIPAGWSEVTAAGVPAAFLTALYGLVDVSGLRRGERVLIHAGAGGVGMAAIQLAHWLGAEVFATAGEAKWQVLRDLGVARDHIASSRTLDFERAFREVTGGAGMDVVLNSLAGEFVDASLRLLAPGGRFTEMGKNDIRPAGDHPEIGYRAFDLDEAGTERMGEMLTELVALFDRGVLHPLPTLGWDIRRAQDAFRFMSQAKHIGKIVLTVPPRWDRDRAVLITGGTGGLGSELARHLAGHGFRKLVLAGRRGPDAAGAAELEAELAAAGCRARIVACDLADQDAAHELVTEIAEREGLTAVVHAAGVLDDGVLETLTAEQLHTVLRPKVDAAWHLHQATRGLDLAGFVLFSSATGVLGTTGQANYAAANTFLDALCAHRRAAGLPGVSLAWGAWRPATGMTGDMSDVDRARLRRSGLPSLSVPEGLALFDAAATTDTALAVPLRVDRTALGERADLPAILRDLAPAPWRRAAARSAGPALDLAERLRGLPAAERRAELSEVVRGQVAVVLGFSGAAAIEENRTFAELGFDSLTAVELRNKLGAALRHKLPATLVFDYPTTTTLVDYLLGTVVGEQEPGIGSAAEMVDRLETALAAPAEENGESEELLARLERIVSRLRRTAEQGADRAGPSEEDINSAPVDRLFDLIDENFASAQD
ncbi:type I polyketide synthase [Amycolatopsis aidingensis]|uniref:type I polyketide synthase n=1 Tax=Amycolatopsis aidingensis TaxID=2842453 RepID=UPI001E634C4F|nr:type I polyketide synthase [Amycolatopsis aidingensis]